MHPNEAAIHDYVDGALDGSERGEIENEIESHLQKCDECASELASMRAFHQDLAMLPKLEPSPNLLAGSRIRLQEALESTTQARGLGLDQLSRAYFGA